uniref:Uncharacterized protein n=1 Tax=Tanacetum cinerariifolium TaxID=118510 RepID=A0A6L2N6N3_TANCI|nr:hypothetical protein [Tanacetum cinerariifolium]
MVVGSRKKSPDSRHEVEKDEDQEQKSLEYGFFVSFSMAKGFLILESLASDAHFDRLNDQIKVLFIIEVGSADCFVEDMHEQCSLVRADMEKRSWLMSKLERLAVGEVATGYLESLRHVKEGWPKADFIEGVVTSRSH